MNKILLIFFSYIWFSLSVVYADAELFISEVFVDGTDEFVEITNRGNSTFHGWVSLSWIKSTIISQTITLEPYESIVFGDNLSYLSTDFSGQKITGLSMDIWDTKQLYISLFIDAEIRDEFILSTWEILSIDNKKTSFHRVWNGSEWYIMIGDIHSRWWVKDGYNLNPWRVYSFIDDEIAIWWDHSDYWNLDEEENQSDDDEWTQDNEETDTNEEYDYSYWDGDENEQNNSEENDNICITNRPLIVDEIYRGNQYGHYIEIMFHEDREGSLILSGDVIWKKVDIWSQFWSKNIRYLITSSITGFVHTDNIILDPELDLSWSGQLSIWSQDWQLRDDILIDTSEMILYRWMKKDCWEKMSIWLLSSPGFDEKFLWYMFDRDPETLICPIYGDGSSWENEWNIQDTDQWSDDNGEITTWSIFTWYYTMLWFTIVSVDYSWPSGWDQDITIRYITGDQNVDLSKLRMRVNWSNKTLIGTISPWSEMVLSRKFWMLKTKETCVELIKWQDKDNPHDIIYDTYCYDPHTIWWTGENSLWWVDYTSLKLKINEIDYLSNPQQIRLQYEQGSEFLDLSKLRLRVNGTNRTMIWWLHQGELQRISGTNFQMLKTKETCVELIKPKDTTYLHDIVYDKKCYTPVIEQSFDDDENIDSYKDLGFMILAVDYSWPSWSEQNITLAYTIGEQNIDLSKFRMRVNGSNKTLVGTISPWSEMVLSRKFGMLKTKETCIEFVYNTHVYDTYCYDPVSEKAFSGEVDIIDRTQLQITSVLPNPKGKDIVWQNEMISLTWLWEKEIVLSKSVYLKINSTKITLSGVVLQPWENTFPVLKTLSNSPSCLTLRSNTIELDRLCYPQASDDTRYFHPRLWIWPSTIPVELLSTLDFQWWSLSKLLLKKVDKKICLTYEGVSIRCMNAWESSTSKKNRALLTLQNAYLSQISTLYYDNKLHPQTIKQWFQSYTILSKRIKSDMLDTFSVYGAHIKPTEIARYVDLTYRKTSDEKTTELIWKLLIGEDNMQGYYRKLYEK